MKFVVSSTTLLKQLQSISGALQSSTPLPILENFLFELNPGELKASASDLETTMSTTIEVESKESGKIAIPAKITAFFLFILGLFPKIYNHFIVTPLLNII